MNDWIVWQLIDSAFPVGGMVHSAGLESAYQAGLVRNADDVREFAISTARQSVRGALLYVMAAHRDSNAIEGVERDWDIILNNHVANRASRLQGQAFVSAVARIFDFETVQTLAKAIRQRRLIGHLAIMFGAVYGQMKITPARTREMFLFQGVRTVISSAVRLGIVGPLEAQSVQAKLLEGDLPRIYDSFDATVDGPSEHAVTVNPVLELLQMSHDRLYSRLFQS